MSDISAIAVSYGLNLSRDSIPKLCLVLTLNVNMYSHASRNVLVVRLVTMRDKEPKSLLISSYLVYERIGVVSCEITDLYSSVFLQFFKKRSLAECYLSARLI